MKRVLLPTIVLLIFVISCAPVPTPQIATATLAPSQTSTPALTPAPTGTPQLTVTPTSTSIAASTVDNTKTPTATTTPAITPMPMNVYKTFNLQAGAKAAGFQNDGTHRFVATSYYEIIKDPTGQFIDQGGQPQYVIHGVITGRPNDPNDSHRPYPVYTDNIAGDYAVEFDLLVDDSSGDITRLGPPPGNNANVWYSVISAGYLDNIRAGIGLITSSRFGTFPFLELYTVDRNSIPERVIHPNPIKYPLGEKTRIRLEFIRENSRVIARGFQGGYDASNKKFLGFTIINQATIDAEAITGSYFRTALYAGKSTVSLKAYNADITLLRR